MAESRLLSVEKPKLALRTGKGGTPSLGSFTVLRITWGFLALLVLGVSVLAFPAVYRQSQKICREPGCQAFYVNELNRPSPLEAETLIQAGFSLKLFAFYQTGFMLLECLICLGLSGILIWKAPANRMAQIMSFVFLLWSICTPGLLTLLPASWHGLLNLLLLAPIQIAWMLMFFLFPDGRFIPRWMAFPALLKTLFITAGILFPASLFNDQNWPSSASLLANTFIFGVLGPFSQLYKYHRASTPLQRQQTKWVTFTLAASIPVAAAILGIISWLRLDLPGLARLLIYPPLALFPAWVYMAFGVAILRYRLWNVDILLNRALVYGALTVTLAGIYVLVVGSLSVILQARGNPFFALLGTGLVALLLHPLRTRLQAVVNRMMYGQREDPYTVFSRLGRQLENTLTPDAVLPTIVETVKYSLKLPYAAILLRQGETFLPAASDGHPIKNSFVLPLLYQGETVGQLILGNLPKKEHLPPSQLQMLENLGRQAGVAVHAARLTADLQQSRQRLVTAREEERRRLRRDLHDGLGPALATQVIRMETAKDLIYENPDQAVVLLAGLVEDSRSALDEIRRLVYELRPPALDELGLLSALHEQAEKYRSAKLNILVELPSQLPPLPAALEVAVYRIALEALTNVARHSQAKNCVLRMTLDQSQLFLEVEDDGLGIPPKRHYGIGLNSMRERAQELGGDLLIDFQPGQGTKIRACLSLSNFSFR
jgi:signal transduction histidine kinase